MSSVKGDKGRKFMVFVFFVAVSFFMWVLKALNEKYEARISIAVTVTGVPNGIELEELEEGELEVIVHDNGTNLIKYLFTDVPPIKVDYSELNDNNGVLTMPVSALTNRASLLFDPSASLLHFNKELLTVRVKLEKKVLPVVVLFDASPAEHYTVKGVKFSPENVEVTAPHAVLNGMSEVNLGNISVGGLERDTAFVIPIPVSEYMSVGTPGIKADISVEKLVSSSLDVPVRFVNFPDAFARDSVISHYAVPEYAKVVFETQKSEMPLVSNEDFAVELDYNELLAASDNKARLKVVKCPAYVFRKYMNVVPEFLDALPGDRRKNILSEAVMHEN